jgi:hypothetical protein
MTPRVLERELEVARMRATDDYKRDLTQAYNFARCYAMVRSKKGLPPLSTLLAEIKDKRDGQKQNVEQMRSVLNVLSGMYGIPLRKAKKAKKR